MRTAISPHRLANQIKTISRRVVQTAWLRKGEIFHYYAKVIYFFYVLYAVLDFDCAT
jgi:hypothetical protein